MTTASAVYKNGEVLLNDAVDWNDGMELEVRPKSVSGGPSANGAQSGRELLEYMDDLYQKHPDSFLSEQTLDELAELQKNPPVSPSHWDERDNVS